ncbi:MAG: CinA family nicotinamide mononucleotide deamidase-related protein [Planctomycetes bacterium]|nr:CinA family nicotinamide mononucleotide deamidase-related protein [Planctomycetota bacterium]
MHAEIIAVGSELTTGEKLDTNSQWLSLALADAGISVRSHLTVADDLEAMVDALRSLAARSELLIVSGGLGPTLDDLTRQALAVLTGGELVLHEPSLEHIREMFARRARPMPERNVIQAMFPAGSTPLPNARGTAPGIWMEWQSPGCTTACRIAALPGVPSELKEMFHREVLPRLGGGARVIRRRRINCFGAGESAVEDLLGELTARGRDPEIGITAHEATITLRIVAVGRTEAECREKLERAATEIRSRLGGLVFGEEDDELEHVVVRQLLAAACTLATAESGTGGLLAHRLTQVMGFRGCYRGGVIVPDDRAKMTLLDVPPDVLAANGPLSAETARAMAEGCRRRFGTDYALAVTECPEPLKGSDPFAGHSSAQVLYRSPAKGSDPVHEPIAWVALAGPRGVSVEEERLAGDPAILRSRIAKSALNRLRLDLLRGE